VVDVFLSETGMSKQYFEIVALILRLNNTLYTQLLAWDKEPYDIEAIITTLALVQ